MNKEDSQNYYAIIPADVRYSTKLKANEKLLYGEISALANQSGVCHAQNSYFARLYDVSNTSISKWISNLVANGFIRSSIVYKKGTKEVEKRLLSIAVKPIPHPIEEKLNTPIEENVNRCLTLVNDPIEEKLKENNTSINNNIYISESAKNNPKSEQRTVEVCNNGSIFTNEQITKIEKIANAHPRKTRPALAIKAITEYVQQRWERDGDGVIDSTLDYLYQKTVAYAKAVEQWPTNQRRFIVGSYSWFSDGCFDEDPKDWERKEQSKSGRPDAPALKKFTLKKRGGLE